MEEVISLVRKERRPFIVHAKVPLLGHHTSGVRKEWYRDDLEEAATRDPYPKLKDLMRSSGVDEADIINIEAEVRELVDSDYDKAFTAEDPLPESITDFIFAPSPITEEKGERAPKGKKKTVMVDSALFAVRELMAKHPESLLYGQDVGGRLGGVFREAATLAQQFGDDRVFNTPIQEAIYNRFYSWYVCCWIKAFCRSAIRRLYMAWLKSIIYRSESFLLPIQW